MLNKKVLLFIAFTVQFMMSVSNIQAKDLSQVPIGIDRIPQYGNKMEKSIAEEMNLNFIHEITQWIEPSPGKYIWKNSSKDTFSLHLEELKKQGYKIQIVFTNVNMDHKHLPVYLKGRQFNDPYLLERWERYLEEFLNRYGDMIDFLDLGNEVNNYFGQHQDEWSEYIEYVKRGSEIIHRKKPHIKIGITLIEKQREQYWRDIELYCDHLTITYYAPCSIFEKSPAAEALNPNSEKYFSKILDEAIRVAGKKKVLIQEFGCATHPTLDSSPQIQAQLIQELFPWIRKQEDKILAISWLSLMDWNYEGTKIALKGQLDQRLLDYTPFMRYLTSLGLIYEDGKKKPGYYALKEEIVKYRGF